MKYKKQNDKNQDNKSIQDIKITKSLVDKIYSTNTGSEIFYKRNYCDELIYTEGVMDFQKKLNTYWVIDLIISYLPTVIKTSIKEDDGFFVVEIRVDKKNSGVFEIFREGFKNGKYDEHICVVRQRLNKVDLIPYNYKFYLIMTNLKPVQYTLLLPSEY